MVGDSISEQIYVSLHYQPECSTSPMGGYFVHQDLMLDILMKVVPNNIKLYVKGHLREGYSDQLMRRLKCDNRTFLLDPSLKAFDLIQKSLAVGSLQYYLSRVGPYQFAQLLSIDFVICICGKFL